MMKKIDLRSDTVTLPTAAMRQAMALAEVGDDVMGEDPTLNELETVAARLVGKEAALFVPSGTMGNLIALLCHTPMRKPEIIAEAQSHIVLNEAGGYAQIAHAALTPIKGDKGAFDPDELEWLIHDGVDVHHPKTALICMENTHNAAGGTVVSLDNIRAVRAVANRRGLAMHLDGARLFNAAAALNIDAAAIADYYDSVMFCLSKGLCAPVGSILAGSAPFIRTARAMRKMLGGGMRQAGILAAAGLVALREMTGRLTEDHETARLIGEGLQGISGLSLDLATVQSNMVRFSVDPSVADVGDFLARLQNEGVLALSTGRQMIRFVTHRHVLREDVALIIRAVRQAANQ